MAPWYKGSLLTGAFGVRWVAEDNNDAVLHWLNAINNAEFRHFQEYGQPAGHDNFNYVVTTWEHRFTNDGPSTRRPKRTSCGSATPSRRHAESRPGRSRSAAAAATATLIPGYSQAYGCAQLHGVRPLARRTISPSATSGWKDDTGLRSGFPRHYTSHTDRPEPQLQRLCSRSARRSATTATGTTDAFDNGTKQGHLASTALT